MTIKEAVQLILITTTMSEGGDVFLLDMGEPKKIDDLARQMVKLQGLNIRSKDYPQGDIEIVYSGLRPGEKLYEELLVDGESLPTKHPLIYKAKEKLPDPEFILSKVKDLSNKCKQLDQKASLEILSELVAEWKSEKYTD